MLYLRLSVTILLAFRNVFHTSQKCLSHSKNGECKECFPGYLGINCSHICRYPNYGPGCQSVCHCDQQDCKPIMGCSYATDCQPGYFGIDCVRECQFPNYGVNCQQFCECKPRYCNKKTGCQLSTKKIQNPSTGITFSIDSVSTSEDITFKSNLVDIKTTFLKLINTTFTYQDNLSWHTRKQNLESTYQIQVLSVDPKSVNFDITFGLVSGILFLAIVLCVVVYKCYRKLRTDRDVKNEPKVIYCQRGEEIFATFENGEKNFDHVSSTSPYDTIEISSSDSDISRFPSEKSDIDVCKNQKHGSAFTPSFENLPTDIDIDIYLCPSSSSKCNRKKSGETLEDNYLTVV